MKSHGVPSTDAHIGTGWNKKIDAVRAIDNDKNIMRREISPVPTVRERRSRALSVRSLSIAVDRTSDSPLLARRCAIMPRNDAESIEITRHVRSENR